MRAATTLWVALLVSTLHAWPASAASATPADQSRATLTTATSSGCVGVLAQPSPATRSSCWFAPVDPDDTDSSDSEDGGDDVGCDALCATAPVWVAPDARSAFDVSSPSYSVGSSSHADDSLRRGPPRA